MDEILAHPFFRSIDRDMLEAYQVDPPFKPDLNTEKYFDLKTAPEELKESIVPKENLQAVKKETRKGAFAGFSSSK